MYNESASRNALGYLIYEVTKANDRWWHDPATGEPRERNVGEMLMLCVSELAEAMEGHRKNLPDDHLPQYPMFEVELVDCIIRLLDIMGHLSSRASEIFVAKMNFNAVREDHKNEHRLGEHGKKY